MSRTIIIVAVLFLALLALYFLFYGGSYNPANNTPAATEPQGADVVTIKNFAFSPQQLTVPAGTTVTWTNQDSAPHQIKSSNFNSSSLSQGESFSFTFEKAGSYDYSCAIHPAMLGKIIVK